MHRLNTSQDFMAKSYIYCPAVIQLSLLLCFGCIRVNANAFSDDDRLCLPASGTIRFERVRFLTLYKNADQNVLDSPSKLPRLSDVNLNSTDEKNARYLKAIVKNYPGIRSLGIEQSAGLSDEALLSLHEFTNLRAVGLGCPICTPSLLPAALPRMVHSLTLSSGNNVTGSGLTSRISLPFVTDMTIMETTVDSAFFTTFQTPNLHTIHLLATTLEPNAIRHVCAFPKLRLVSLRSTPISDEDVAYLREHGIHVKPND
jgi:hypothetical protein